MIKSLFFFFLLFHCLPKVYCQEKLAEFVKIKEIIIDGNRKTKDFIIKRELDFKEGDSIPANELDARLLLCRNRLFNTRLFTQTSLKYEHDTIFIDLKERFYTYPLLILGLADRNFNEWWEIRNHDFRRINYGIDFIQRNMRGRNEQLKVVLQSGFSQKAELAYTIPYLDKHRKTGMMAALSYISEKKVAFTTAANMLAFTEGTKQLRRRFLSSLTFFHRSKYYSTYYLSMVYNNNLIGDTIASLNPRYFLHGRTRQQYFSLRLYMVHDRRDVAYYPLKGHFYSWEINKQGLFASDHLNQLNVNLNLSLFKQLSEKLYLGGTFSQKLSFPKNQPYYNFKAIGYNVNTVSGYELYVVDGQHFSLFKMNLKYRFFNTSFHFPFIPIPQFRSIPLAIYFKIYSDAGYVTDQTNIPGNEILSNTWLWGNGAGLDFVTFYDLVFRVEYSVNRRMEHGVFLHMKAAF